MCQRMLRLPSRTNSRPTRMEALLNPLRTGIILLEHMNDNAEAKQLGAEPVIASHLRFGLQSMKSEATGEHRLLDFRRAARVSIASQLALSQ